VIQTKILQFGNNTGIHLTEEMLDKLGGGRKPLVKVTLNNYTYRSAVGKVGDLFVISLSSEHRENSKVKGGDKLEILIEVDTEPRTVEIPDDFKEVLQKNESAAIGFEKLAPSKKKAMIAHISGAKTKETRNRRINKAVDQLSK
jgi:autonomous glycyl radical cofactor GrcA